MRLCIKILLPQYTQFKHAMEAVTCVEQLVAILLTAISV